MSLEMERRVAKLEEEMADLRQELSELRRIQSNEKINTLDARQSMIEQSVPIQPTPTPTPKPTVEPKSTPVKTAQKRCNHSHRWRNVLCGHFQKYSWLF